MNRATDSHMHPAQHVVSLIHLFLGVETSLDMLSRGIKFSWPIYKSGYQVLISSHLIAGDTWAFAQAFHWSVWLLLGATSIVVAFIVAIMERLTLKDAANKKGAQAATASQILLSR